MGIARQCFESSLMAKLCAGASKPSVKADPYSRSRLKLSAGREGTTGSDVVGRH